MAKILYAFVFLISYRLLWFSFPGSVETGRRVHKIPGGKKGDTKHVGHTSHVLCLAISSDGKYLVRRRFGWGALQCIYDVCAISHAVAV